MSKQPSETYDYDSEAGILDVYFSENRSAWTIELTDNILISIDRHIEEVVSLTFLDYSVMVQPGPLGRHSFPLIGLDTLPTSERILVIKVLTAPPVKKWLDLSTVFSDSPITVARIAFVPPELQFLTPQAA